MAILAFISFASFLVYVYLGTIVYLRNPDNALNRVFFIFSIIIVYTGLTDFLMRISESYASAFFWYRVGILWHLAISALIHFILVFIRWPGKKYDKWIYVALYGVGIAFVVLDYYGGYVVSGPEKSPWGWSYGSVRQTPVGVLYVIWAASMMLLGIVLCLKHYLNTTSQRTRKQAMYVLFGSFIPMAAGLIEIFLTYLSLQVPNLLYLGITIGSGFWAFAIWKYELFVLSPVSSAKEIIATMSDALLLISPERRIKVVNAATCELLGYAQHELIDRHVHLLFDETDYQAIIDGSLPSELALRGYISDAEIPVRTKQGLKIIVSMAASLVRDKADRFQGLAVICRDITRRKKEEQELQHYKEHLEQVVEQRTAELEKTYAQLQRVQKLEFMGTIAGGVAHDLNNILSGITTYPELLMLDLPGDSPMIQPLTTIRKSGEKAATIVQDLLTLARREVVTKSVVNLNAVVMEYMQSPEHHRLQYYHPHARVVTRLYTNLPNLTGSPVHLSKILMNLVSNAMEAMPEGGEVTVSTAFRKLTSVVDGYEAIDPGAYVVLSVSDTGTGIAPEDLEHIFEPFYTRKKMGQSGTGLGMAVVWGTLKDHGGFADLDSRPGQGSTFTLYFPASVDPLADTADVTPTSELRGNGEIVLVVDDVAEQREIASAILRKLGYSVAVVPSGEAAVESLKENPADILLLDMIMNPGIDGLETYRRILAVHPGQKAVIASGFSENERVKEARFLGAGAFVRKPYTVEDIGKAIKSVLDTGEKN